MALLDVVSDAAGHLAECQQPLLLHDRLLGLPEIIVGTLQSLVELCLVCRQRDVLTDLP